MRAQQARTFAEAKVIRLDDPEEVQFWTDRLDATPEEIAEAIAKVGSNRIAVELYFTAPTAGSGGAEAPV